MCNICADVFLIPGNCQLKSNSLWMSALYNNIGNSYYLEMMFNKSLEFFRKALIRSSGVDDLQSFVTLVNCGNSLAELKDYKLCIAEYSKALAGIDLYFMGIKLSVSTN